MTHSIRPLKEGEHQSCEKILRSLPEWFGIEKSINEYVLAIQTMDTWVLEKDNHLLGFITINQHNDCSAEIHVMAILKENHRCGYGRQLILDIEKILKNKHIKFLQVKTLSNSHPDKHYAMTRKFYKKLGFKPLEENILWGEKNPCLIMVKYLQP